MNLNFIKIFHVIASIAVWGLMSFGLNAQNYSIQEILVEPFGETIERTGKVGFKRTLNMSFKNSGYLTQLSVDAGDLMTKGQVLASLETEELIAAKNSTYAKLLQAKREVERIEQLMEKNLSSERELDTAQTIVETNRSAYRVAYYNLERSQIIAPYDGIVLKRESELGEYHTPGREIIEIAALAKNRVVKVALTGSEISQVKLHQKVIIELPRLGEMIGEVNRIPAIADNNGNLFTIDILLPDFDYGHGLIAGQLAVVKINSAESRFVYRLPIEALVSIDREGKAVVMVQDHDGSNPHQQAFDFFKLDNRFVYLNARKFDDSLRIVTQGWQHLRVQK